MSYFIKLFVPLQDIRQRCYHQTFWLFSFFCCWCWSGERWWSMMIDDKVTVVIMTSSIMTIIMTLSWQLSWSLHDSQHPVDLLTITNTIIQHVFSLIRMNFCVINSLIIDSEILLEEYINSIIKGVRRNLKTQRRMHLSNQLIVNLMQKNSTSA